MTCGADTMSACSVGKTQLIGAWSAEDVTATDQTRMGGTVSGPCLQVVTTAFAVNWTLHLRELQRNVKSMEFGS